MSDLDWKLVLQKYFEKKIQAGNHAYRLSQPVTIRVDGKDISLPKGSLFTFPQDGLASISEQHDKPENYHIALKSISTVIAFENEAALETWAKLGQ